MEDFYIGIINEGTGPNVKSEALIEPTYLWDNKPYIYKVTVPGAKPVYNVVPLVVANEHFAVKVDEHGHLMRDTIPDQSGESTFTRNLAKLCPKVPLRDEEGKVVRDMNGRVAQYIDDPKFKDWYSNGVKFKLKKIPRTMSAEEFAVR